MSLLSYNQLVSQVVLVKVVAERDNDLIPLSLVNASSIDIRLGRRLLKESSYSYAGVIDYRAREQLCMTDEPLSDGSWIINPGEFVLTESEEVFHLPNHLSFEYKLKSSMARIGLEHLTAGWADAGWNNSVLTLELKNMTQHHVIRIRPGDRIGQLTFFEHEEVPRDRSYATRGRYNNDSSVSGAKRSA